VTLHPIELADARSLYGELRNRCPLLVHTRSGSYEAYELDRGVIT
jgi:hypothetical protein